MFAQPRTQGKVTNRRHFALAMEKTQPPIWVMSAIATTAGNGETHQRSRLGSLADIATSSPHVRFTPNSDHKSTESGHSLAQSRQIHCIAF
jgi:hypothetical protein